MKHIRNLTERYPALAVCEAELRSVTLLLIETFAHGGKLLLCGNGGSSADCEHIAGELMKGFLKPRRLCKERREALRTLSPSLTDATLASLQGGLAAIPLPSLTALGTAFANDESPALSFAQATLALGREGDALLAVSTSGNAENVLEAARVAKGLGMSVIGLTGEGGGALLSVCDLTVRVPERETYKVQELHLPVYHAICAEIEEYFFA